MYIGSTPHIALRTMEICDYVPFVSTAFNLVHLFTKCVVIPLHAQNPIQNRYYNHLNDKSFSRCILLLIPVVGNIYVWIKNHSPVNCISDNLPAPMPNPLPQNCVELRASRSLRVSYLGGIVNIPIGDTYYTKNGQIMIGYHGSYNPPVHEGMY